MSGAGAILRLSTIPRLNQITPLPQCERGAGGEGGPSRNGCASTVRAQ